MRTFILGMVCVVTALAAGPVQQVACNNGSATPLTCTFGATPTNGNVLYLLFSGNQVSDTVASVSQTGVSWSGSPVVSSHVNRDAEIWVGTVGAGAGTAVTINLNSTSSTVNNANVSEWTYTNTSDGTNTSNGSSTTPTTGTVTTANAVDVVLAIYSNGNGNTFSSGPTNSFTALTTNTNARADFAYLEVVSTGTYSTGWTMTSAISFDTAIAAFKKTGGGGANAAQFPRIE